MTLNQTASPSAFRQDINGLRAWAVVVVILYHFGISGFTGGFVGVDVFFVISGFLMTGIVVTGLERSEGFSVWGFYLARARRILPALIVLCAALIALGWWVLMPVDYKILGTHVIASLAFVSNIKFWRETGYFDAESHEKWLLHTWSLAAEWQFYMLLPLALLAIWKWRSGRRTITVAIAVGLIASLCLSVLLTPRAPTAAFYLLPTRAWEMLAGGLVYLMAHRLNLCTRQRAWLEAVGLALVLAAVFGFDAKSPWPGWRALVPVVGSVLVLIAARPQSHFTVNPVAQWLGTRSYSIYLWHWPIVVALGYFDLQAHVMATVSGLILTMLLGDLSYRFVETTARRKLSRMHMQWSAVAVVCGIFVVAIPSAWIRMKQGVLGRVAPEIELISQEAVNRNPRLADCHPETGRESPSCMHGDGEIGAIVMGDSHANTMVTSLTTASQRRTGVLEWSYRACPTLQGVRSHRGGEDYPCGDLFDWEVQKLQAIPKDVPIVVVNRDSMYVFGQNEYLDQTNTPWVHFSQRYMTAEPAFLKEYAQRLTETVCMLAKDHPVYLMRPIPELGADVPRTARAMLWGKRKDVSISLSQYHERENFIWGVQNAARDRCGIKILDPLPYLCWDGVCHDTKDGRSLYFDSNHLSEFGNKLLVPMFAEVFQTK